MIDFDSYLIEFVRTNIVSISLLLAILKVVARETPWAIDDKIIEIFTNFTKRKDICNTLKNQNGKKTQIK